VEAFQNRRLLLTITEPLAISTAIGVEHNGALFLGEVIRRAANASIAVGRESWRLEVRVEQILNNLQNLATLRRRLSGESLSERPVGSRMPVSC
jgi:hypothetical protein